MSGGWIWRFWLHSEKRPYKCEYAETFSAYCYQKIWNLVEKRAGKAREPEARSAQAEIRKPREPKSEKRASGSQKSARA